MPDYHRLVKLCLAAFCFVLLVPATSLWGQPPTIRKWSDKSGQYDITAKFEKLVGDSVVLRKTNGDSVTVPIARLSQIDRRYLEGIEERVLEAEKNAYKSREREITLHIIFALIIMMNLWKHLLKNMGTQDL